MTYVLKLYFTTLFAFLAIDLVWLGLVAGTLYRQYLGSLMTPNPNWFVAILFYLLYVAGVLVLVVLPGLKQNSLKTTLLRGAFFGLVAYATYDLTNLATLQGWPVLITLVDLVWGTILSLVVSYISFLAGKRLSQSHNQ